MLVKPLKQIKLTDQIVSHLRALIIDGEMRPGDPLPSESELARQLGVGRPTVREAINALSGMGLVRVTSGKPPVVGSVTGDSVTNLIGHAITVQQVSPRETLQFRRFLEERSVELAAVNRSDEDVALLKTILSELFDSIGDVERFVTADIAFHKTVARASGNQLVQLIIEGITEAAQASSRRGLQLITEAADWRVTYDVHDAIAEAIYAKDAPQAATAMRNHFDVAWARMQRSAQPTPFQDI